MYTTSKKMIQKARAGGYAVPAFNAENLEMVQAIVAAASQMRSPVMIQTTPTTVKYLTLRQAVAMVRAEGEAADVPVALHLDHCESFEGVRDAVQEGYTSVMIDGSKLPYEENIALTRKVVEMAAARGVTVEAELGTVGGKEDGRSADIAYTDPAEAVDFFTRTGVDIFAVAIDKIDAPLVLHGGSGIPDEMIRRTIELGINKVNFATELRAAATKAVRSALEDAGMIDPKKYMGPAREAVIALCKHKIQLCGSDGKAD